MKNLKYICSIFLFWGLLFVTSCSNEPTTPPPPPEDIDTIDRYEWSIDTIYGYSFNNLYVADSNNVFITAFVSFIYYNGTSYEPINLYDPFFSINSVNGYNQDNIFVGGGRRDSIGYPPILKKVVGNNVFSYDIEGDMGGRVSDIFVEGSDQTWLSTSESNIVYYFNSGIFTPYTLDSGVRLGGFFRDSLNTLYCFALKLFTAYNFRYYIYKYSNDSFNLINIDSVNTISELRPSLMRCGSDMIALGRTSIYYFNNPFWEKLCNTPDFMPMRICGTSKNNIVCYGTTGDYAGNMYTWNGEKWHKEKSQVIPKNFYFSVSSAMVNRKVNLIISDWNNLGVSYHLRGTPKD